jgi:hypothetical protein
LSEGPQQETETAQYEARIIAPNISTEEETSIGEYLSSGTGQFRLIKKKAKAWTFPKCLVQNHFENSFSEYST